MKSFLRAYLRQIKDFTALMLILCIFAEIIAEGIRGSDGWADSIIIFIILMLNFTLGAFQEYRAEKILGDVRSERPTPMQKRLGEVGKALCIISAVFCCIVFVLGIMRGGRVLDMLLLSLSLAVAAIPESLPAIMTIMLSVGVCRLSAKKISVRRLTSAEGLGRIGCLFLKTDRLSPWQKEEFRRSGIRVFDIEDKKAFSHIRKRYITAVIGESAEDRELMEEADIGCCMYESRELYDSAHIVFGDCEAILGAVREGRVIYENLERSIHFLLSCNLGEILVVLSSLVLGLDMPLLAAHLLLINLITDCLPAIALSLEPYDDSIMKGSWHAGEKIFSEEFIIRLIFEGVIIGGVSFAAFVYGTAYGGVETGRTMTFCVLSLSQLFHSFNMRKGSVLKNPLLDLSFVVGGAMTAAAVSVPALMSLFCFAPLNPALWLCVFLLSLLPFIIFKTKIKKSPHP